MKKIILLIGILTLVIITLRIYGVFFQGRKPKQQGQASVVSPTDFVSKDFKEELTFPKLFFTVTVLSNYRVQEQPTRVIFRNEFGEIIITRSATNFDDLNDYLQDLDSKNRISILEKENKTINGYESVVRKIKYSTGLVEKHYKIFVENFVYTISTSSQSLYYDLDQIAQSFRYTP